MRSLRVLVYITLAIVSYMLLTGISSCRGTVGTNWEDATLFIYEVEGDYNLDWGGEGRDTAQMAAYLWWDSEHSSSSLADLNPADLVWYVSDPEVLSISSTGMVETHYYGECDVYATYSGGSTHSISSPLISNTVTFYVVD